MGMKFLRLQMLPWCFHLLGNHISCIHIRADHHDQEPIQAVKTIKLIKSDGIVKIYRRPINVSDLMLEFPKHLVCHSDSFFIGQKVKALSKNDKLKLGHKYFLLPKHFFQSVLSFVTIASFASNNDQSSNSNNAVVKKAARNCQPFIIRKTASGSLQIRVSDEFISRLMEEGRIKNEGEEEESLDRPKGRLCTTPQLQKDYTLLVDSRQWKPKLETIRESKRKRLGSFGIKRRKKAHQSKGLTPYVQKGSPRTETSKVAPSTSKGTMKTKGTGKSKGKKKVINL